MLPGTFFILALPHPANFHARMTPIIRLYPKLLQFV